MEEKDDIFKFEDFLGGNKMEDLKKMKSNLLKEGLFSDRYEDDEVGEDKGILNHINDEDDEDEIDQSLNPYNTISDESSEEDSDDEDFGWEGNPYDYIENGGFMESNDSDNDETYDEEDSYVLYKDKSEEFVCDIAIEGVSQKDTEVRLVIESSDWNIMFKGEVKNGKCIIPIKKLSLFNEGQRGNIKLEVNADGSLFTPWEDEFIIKTSKKVTVSLNENKKPSKETGVKVKVNKKRP